LLVSRFGFVHKKAVCVLTLTQILFIFEKKGEARRPGRKGLGRLVSLFYVRETKTIFMLWVSFGTFFLVFSSVFLWGKRAFFHFVFEQKKCVWLKLAVFLAFTKQFFGATITGPICCCETNAHSPPILTGSTQIVVASPFCSPCLPYFNIIIFKNW